MFHATLNLIMKIIYMSTSSDFIDFNELSVLSSSTYYSTISYALKL